MELRLRTLDDALAADDVWTALAVVEGLARDAGWIDAAAADGWRGPWWRRDL